MNKAFEGLKRKVAETVKQGDVLIQELEKFAWRDDRPRRTKAKQTLSLNFDTLVETPATRRIPPSFVRGYHTWYAICLALVETNMPSRVGELVRVHEVTKESHLLGATMRSLLQRESITFDEQIRIRNNLLAITAIIESIPGYVEGRLYDIELEIAQVYIGDQLQEAEALLKAGYIRPAGALAGVLLERNLKTLCDHHQPPLKYTKTAGISNLNDLLKNAGAYDTVQWRKVQWMGDVRNSCDHANKAEPKKADVADLIGEVRKFVALFTA